MIRECFFPDREKLFNALLKECSDILKSAVEEKQAATMLVSGGGTPRPLYQQLSFEELNWQQVNIALVDERWVDVDHLGSNEAFIRQTLLQNKASAAKLTGMKTPGITASLGLQDCDKNYQNLSRPFDLTILGMGPDAHTASLFPEAQGLERALDSHCRDLCVDIYAKPSDVTGDLTERMSLSFYGLMQSRQLHLVITGNEKLDVYERALSNNDITITPISAVLQQQKIPVNVYWAP